MIVATSPDTTAHQFKLPKWRGRDGFELGVVGHISAELLAHVRIFLQEDQHMHDMHPELHTTVTGSVVNCTR